MHYGLDDRPNGAKLWVYTIQFLAFSVANSAVIPVLVGSALGLQGGEIASLVQRTFFFCAVGSFLQVLFGHKYPIFEGPAGIWFTMFIVMGTMAAAMGKPLPTLRTDLEFGLLVAGALTVLFGAFGLMGKVARLFTPIVNGVFLSVLAYQISPSIIKGMLGIVSEGSLSGKASLVAVITVVTTAWFMLKSKGFLNSSSILIGTLVGWGAALAFGLTPLARWEPRGILSLPEIFAWGMPTYDAGVVLTCVLGGVIVLSNLVASLVGMAELTGTVADAKRLNRGALFTGVSDLLGGVGSVVGFIPYASSLGLVSISRVSSRLPFILSTLVLGVLALFPYVGNLFAALPPAVGYSILLVTFSQIIVMGVSNFSRTGLDGRSGIVIGISLMVGVGIMSVPQGFLQVLPAWSRYLVSNGLIVATGLSLLLENLVPAAKR